MKTYDYSKVELDNGRVQAIISAGFEEFANNGYKKASTNKIAEVAGVARGLIYYYFTDKEGLFRFLMHYGLNLVVEGLSDILEWKEPDLLTRITTIAKLKCKVLSTQPKILDFLVVNVDHYDEENLNVFFKGSKIDIKKTMAEVYYSKVDYSLFKEGLDPEKTVEVIRWTMEKIGEEWLAKSRSGTNAEEIDAILQKIDEYMAYLRGVFYK